MAPFDSLKKTSRNTVLTEKNKLKKTDYKKSEQGCGCGESQY